MNELQKSKDFLEIFGAKSWPMISEMEPLDQREIEPWMVDFMKKRHPPEAWEAFYAYYNSGPLKRAYCRFMGLVFDILRIH